MANTMKIKLTIAALLIASCVNAQDLAVVLKAEAERVAVAKRVKPSVVAVFAKGGQGGGTGVLISEDGYALTNFHVVQPTGPTMQCGLPDGVLYDGVLVGLDKVGDVALIKLLPKQKGQKFPFAPLGNSDEVREGDWSLAMGNPFLLATDFTPTITYGLVSGVNRYQYPAGLLLEYTDCIQIDTSINPGNSGGPLFNMKGELIGINGRGSFDKRGRVNSGVGYAISINQIKNFMGHLRAGIDSDHASLGALIGSETEKSGLGKMRVRQILEDCDAARRGLDTEDELISFAGRQMTSTNHFKNVLGIYPRGWRVPLEYKHEKAAKKEILVRLMGMQRKTLNADDGLPPEDDPDVPKQPMPKPKPAPKDKDGKPLPKVIPMMPKAMPFGEGAKMYEAKEGFANFYFNKMEKNRLLAAFSKTGDFSSLAGAWTIEGVVRLKKLRTESPAKLELIEEKDEKGSQPLSRLSIDSFSYQVLPLKPFQESSALRQPDSSGGLLATLYLWQNLLVKGEKGFAVLTHGGVEPIYPPPTDVSVPKSLADLRVDAEVLVGQQGGFTAKWYFSRSDAKLIAAEVRMKDSEDPCEIYFGDYKQVEGRWLPHRLSVLYGDMHYGTFAFSKFGMK